MLSILDQSKILSFDRGLNLSRFFIGLIHVLEVVNIRRGPKNGLTPECEARGC